MKHYVLGLVFNKDQSKILLVNKKRPSWMKGMFNGIGGKIEEGELPEDAMHRESFEETGYDHRFEHALTFTCPGGTVYVFMASDNSETIAFKQIEDEILSVWDVQDIHSTMPVMANLKWIIPLCLSTVQLPISVHQIGLGIE